MFELKASVCERCGGAIDRNTMRCQYCDTEYKREHEDTVIRFVPERPGVHTIRACVKLDDALSMRNPEAATAYATDKLRQGIAKGLLDYLRLSVEHDPMQFCQIIRGEVRVIDPTFSEWE